MIRRTAVLPAAPLLMAAFFNVAKVYDKVPVFLLKYFALI